MQLCCVNRAAVSPAHRISLIFVITSHLFTKLLASPTFARVGRSWFAFLHVAWHQRWTCLPVPPEARLNPFPLCE